MSEIDLFSFALLAVGLLLGFLLLNALKRNKLGPEKWSRVIGVGAGVFLFISLIVAREMFNLVTDLFIYITISFLLSLGMGIVAWFGGRIITQHKK